MQLAAANCVGLHENAAESSKMQAGHEHCGARNLGGPQAERRLNAASPFRSPRRRRQAPNCLAASEGVLAGCCIESSSSV